MTEEKGAYIVKYDKLLGSGSFGKAYICYKKNNPQEEFCMKIIKKSELNDPQGEENKKKQLQAEINVVQDLKHTDSENLVKLIDFLDLEQELCIIMELCDYDLSQEYKELKKKQQWFSRSEQIEIIKQILKGAKVLIQNKFVHRDIKPQNILVKIANKGLPNQRKIYKLADFGFTRPLDDIYKKSELTRVGTYVYCAPEIIKNFKFSAKCDIFSYGVVFHQLVFNGSFPDDYKNQIQMNEFIRKIENNPYQCQKLQGKYGDILTNLIEKMLLFNQDHRITFENLLSHEIVTMPSPILADSLFLEIDRKFEKEDLQKLQSENQQSKYDKIYTMIDIFYRKYLLCQSVINYINQEIFIFNPEFSMIKQLIGMIGLEEIKFAFAMLFIIVSDFQSFIKDKHDIPHLIEILKNYLEYSKQSQKDKNLHQKILKCFYKHSKEMQESYNSLTLNLKKEGSINKFKEQINFFEEALQQKIEIQRYCHTLEEYLNNQKINLQIQKFDQKIQQSIQNIMKIETKFEIEKYYFLNPEEIFEIQNK